MRTGSVAQAVVLTVLMWPVCFAGGFLGALIGVIGGSQSAGRTSWAALGWAIGGVMLGAPIAVALLGLIWARLCRRRWPLPFFGLPVLVALGAILAFPLINEVPGTDNDALRIVGACAVALAVTGVTYLIGRGTPARRSVTPVPAV